MTVRRLTAGSTTGVNTRRPDAHEERLGELIGHPERRVSPDLSPLAVLALQRSAGNRAVAAMLGRQPAPAAPARDAGADPARDAGADAGRDAGADAGRDAGADAGAKPASPLVPGLGPAGTADVDEALRRGDRREALARLLKAKVADHTIDLGLLENATMTFDPEMKGSDGWSSMPWWDAFKNKADPTKVKIGPGAFSSIAYLYSVVMHEYQHVLWRQSESNVKRGQQAREQGFKSTSEVEAYAWELGHAADSGIDRQPEKAAEIWGHLNEEFWQLGPDDQTKMRPAALAARKQAERIVQGSKVTLAPFAR